MSQDAQIIFEAGVLPEGVCPQNEQERFNLFVQFLSGFLPGNFTAWNIGTTTPTVDNQDKPWLKLNADGSMVRSFTYSSGVWNAPYTFPAGPNNLRMLWAGALVDLDTFDGGSAGAVTAFTGPFWEKDANFDDRLGVGAGALAVNTNTDAFTAAAGTTEMRGVYFIKRTARTSFVA